MDSKIEIILIDNSNEGKMASKLKRRPNNRFPLHCYHEPKIGIPHSRNAAVHIVKQIDADWIAFIDDDEIAPHYWIKRLFEGLKNNDANLIVGGVEHVPTLEETIREAYSWKAQGRLTELPVVDTAVTSNVLFDARFVKQPHNLLFDTAMVFGGSDREFFMRA